MENGRKFKGQEGFDLKFNLLSSSLYVKLLKNIKIYFPGKKERVEGRIKWKKINLSEKEKNMNMAWCF